MCIRCTLLFFLAWNAQMTLKNLDNKCYSSSKFRRCSLIITTRQDCSYVLLLFSQNILVPYWLCFEYPQGKIQMFQNLMKYFENCICVYANGKRIFTIHKLPMICLLIKVFWNSDRCGFTVFSDNLTLIFSCETQTIYCMWFHYDTACYSIQFENGQYVISWIIIF